MILNILLLGLLAGLVLTILIVAHELGHFIIAKKSGIFVEEFGVGLPPRIWGKKIGETLYSINALPIGGFVRLHGESNDEEISQPQRAFLNKPPKVKAAVAVAGVLANFLFAIFAFAVVYSFTGIPTGDLTVAVSEVPADTPAAEAGLQQGDVIISADDEKIDNSQEFVQYTDEHRGEEINVTILRSGNENAQETVVLTPRENPPEGQGPVGIVISEEADIYYPPIWQRPFVGAYYGVREAFNLSKAIVLGLFGLAGQVSQGQAPEGVVGPVGILGLIAYILRLGLLPTINFLGIFSVNLAVLNLIPFPPLDGFRLLTSGVEGIFGKKILPKFEATAQSIGMILLLLLMVIITVREVPKAFQAESLSGFVESIIPLE